LTSCYHALRLRAARLLLITLTAAAFACGGPEPKPARAPAAALRTTSPAPQKPPAVWARFAELAAWEPVTKSPIASRGHAAGNWELEVRVNPESRDAYLALRPGTSLPDGSVVVASHRDIDRGQNGPIYVMEKKTGHWSFQVLSPEGRPSEHGPLTLCARCHAEAAADMLFGLPRPSARD